MQVRQRFLVVEDNGGRAQALLGQGGKALLFDDGLSELGETEVLSVEPSTGRIKVARLPANVTDFIIVRADTVPTHVTIRNNRFHDNRARGIIVKGSDILIEGNVIERVTMEAILSTADTGPWYEGPGAQNVTIRNNRISDANRHIDRRGEFPSAISVGVSLHDGTVGKIGSPIRHILVEGNKFTHIYSNPRTPAFFGKGVADTQERDE